MNVIKFGTTGIGNFFKINHAKTAEHGWIHWLLICFHNDFEYFDGTKMTKAKKNQCIIYPPHTKISYGPDFDKDTSLEYSWCWFYGSGIKNLLDELKLPLKVPFDMGNTNCVTTYIKKINDEQSKNGVFSGHFVSVYIYEMLVTLARERMIALHHNHKYYEAIVGSREYMQSHCSDKISLTDIANNAGYSVSRYSNLYNKVYGCSPIADLLNIRIEKAKKLLQTSELSINDISDLCGFETIHYFSSKFKEITGVSPSKYKTTHYKTI